MATAYELLNSLADTVPVHSHKVTDSDTYFIIDPITRQITNTAATKNVLVQFDHDSERFTFELPRYVEGHDMMLCNHVKVHYNNIDGETGVENIDVYDVEDLRIDPKNSSNVICSWLISRNATQMPGALSFLVQYLCTDSEGNVTYEWHTDIFSDIEIITGRNNGEAAVIEYTDILEQWRARLFGAGDSVIADIESTTAAKTEAAVAEIEAKGAETLATIPPDYTTTHNMADEALRKKADAVVLSESGDGAITLDDSSDNNLLGLNLYGKTTQVKTNGYQLFDASRLNSYSTGGATVTNNGDGSFTIGGNGTLSNTFSIKYECTHAETLALLKTGMIYRNNINSNPYFAAYIYYNTNNYHVLADNVTSSREITEDMFSYSDAHLRIYFYGAPGSNIISGTIKPMLYQDGDGTWEPYSGGHASPSPDYPQELTSFENPEIEIYGKNLIEPKANKIYGYTSTVNPDGSITITGAATTTDPIYVMLTTISDDNPLILKKGVSYSFSGESTNGINAGIKTIMDGGTIEWALISDWNRLIGSNEHKDKIAQIFLESTGHTVGDTRLCGTYKIQLEANDRSTEFEGFKAKQTLSNTRTLHGVPVSQNGNYTDSNGQQWICDEIDFERGKFIQRVGESILNGTESLVSAEVTDTSPGVYYYYPGNVSTVNTGICSHFRWNPTSGIVAYYSGYFDIRYGQVRFSANGYDTVDAFKQMLSSKNAEGNPVTVSYILATPIETDLTSAELQAFRALHTNKTNTTILNSQKAGMKCKYVANIEQYVYKNVQSKARLFDITLPAANWVDKGDYYCQVVNESIRPSSKIDLSPTVEQLISILNDGYTMFAGNNNGVLTVYSIGATPGKDMTINAVETVVVYE